MKPILVTGASGYIGGRLVPQLVAKGYPVRCLARDSRKVSGRGWGDEVEVIAGDVLDRDSLAPAMAGCAAAYYLVHSMAGGERDFEERDRQAARNFADAAGEAGVEHLIYLGGLGKRSEPLSAHLNSRHEVGDILREGTVPATELRAAMIIGSGSSRRADPDGLLSPHALLGPALLVRSLPASLADFPWNGPAHCHGGRSQAAAAPPPLVIDADACEPCHE